MVLLALTLLPLIHRVLAWNADVHQQIGFLAEAILDTEPLPTLPILAQFLEPEYEGSIGRAGGWADEYKDTPEGKHSYIWHWITANDKAPDYCNLYYWRDCGKAGCVVSAIEQQTAILTECVETAKKRRVDSTQSQAQDVVSGQSSVNSTCSHALKWIVHFLGDVSQPLHASGRAFGGNLEKVNFGGQMVRLHEVWDRYIIYHAANVASFANDTLQPFFTNILDHIASDTLLEPRSGWLSCDNAQEKPRARQCAMAWAREANQWNCDYVYGRKDWNSTDLKTGGYSEDAFPIVETQLAKAGFRLAQWLFRIVNPDQSMSSDQFAQRFVSRPASGTDQHEL